MLIALLAIVVIGIGVTTALLALILAAMKRSPFS